MKWLVVVLMVTLALAVPAASTLAQGVQQAPPEVVGPAIPAGGFCNFFGLAPDLAGSVNLSYFLAVSNITGGSEAIQISSFPFPFTSFTERTFAFAPRETKFFGPADVLCSGTVCELFICSNTFGTAFQLDSLIVLINKISGAVITTITPFRFTT